MLGQCSPAHTRVHDPYARPQRYAAPSTAAAISRARVLGCCHQVMGRGSVVGAGMETIALQPSQGAPRLPAAQAPRTIPRHVRPRRRTRVARLRAPRHARARGPSRRQRDQLARLFDFDAKETRVLVLNNADWLVTQRLVEFLRDVGKHFSVNVMLQKESVKARLEAGISYTEFSYMLLQAYDFLHLYRKEQCTIQVGGSDQWGNITAGIDLIRRVEGGEAHGLVGPLFTTASGAKFGKTEAGSVWLDPSLTSPYKLYQFWMNTDDRDAERYLKLFTLLSQDEIKALLKSHHKDPSRREAQKKLAIEVTQLVHGKEACQSAVAASAILFDEFSPRDVEPSAFDALAQEIPTVVLQSRDGLTLVDAVVRAGLAKSKSEARRQIEQGGIYLNQERVKDVARTIGPADWIAGGNLLLRKGKKDYGLVRLSR